nr:MAG TPA: hypothetical protein [Caudoviricetes sp.]
MAFSETLQFRGFGGTTPSPHTGLAPTRYSEIVENGLLGNVAISRFWGHYPLPPYWTSAHEV